MSLPADPGSPDYFIPWRPTCLVVDERDLDVQLGLAAIMYRRDLEAEPVGYDLHTLNTVRTEVTWLLLSLIHGGDIEPSPIILT